MDSDTGAGAISWPWIVTRSYSVVAVDRVVGARGLAVAGDHVLRLIA
jgi:hypothetical protein